MYRRYRLLHVNEVEEYFVILFSAYIVVSQNVFGSLIIVLLGIRTMRFWPPRDRISKTAACHCARAGFLARVSSVKRETQKKHAPDPGSDAVKLRQHNGRSRESSTAGDISGNSPRNVLFQGRQFNLTLLFFMTT